jgi:hypothetical protein
MGFPALNLLGPGPVPFGIFRACRPIADSKIAPYPAGAWQRHMHLCPCVFLFSALIAEFGYCLALLLSGSAFCVCVCWRVSASNSSGPN